MSSQPARRRSARPEEGPEHRSELAGTASQRSADMTEAASPPPGSDHGPPGYSATVGVVLGLVAALAFGLLLMLVVGPWSPLQSVDVASVDAVNALVAPNPDVVAVLQILADLGGARTAVALLSLTIIWLILRRLFRLAFYVAVTGIGLAVLDPTVKALVDRPRPLPEFAVASAPGPSFPSGHAMTSLVTYGLLVLVFLPAVAPRLRRAVIAGAAIIVVIVGITRVALGVHYPSDVVAGWLLGSVWLAVTTGAFRADRAAQGMPDGRLGDGLAPEDSQLLRAPPLDHPLRAVWRSVSQLLVGGVLLWGALVVVGFAVTAWLPAVRRFDRQVVEWLVGLRSDDLTTLLRLLGHLGDTVVIVAVAGVGSVILLASTRRWAPALFLVLAASGQAALYWAASRVVERPRPSFADLATANLPAQASFPSGHVAATVATYGAIALLLVVLTKWRLGYAAIAFAVVAALAVASSRVYLAVHFPTDVVVSLLYASAWLALCWHVLRPRRGSATDDGDGEDAVDSRRLVGAEP